MYIVYENLIRQFSKSEKDQLYEIENAQIFFYFYVDYK